MATVQVTETNFEDGRPALVPQDQGQPRAARAGGA